jgi:hypothetical protein
LFGKRWRRQIEQRYSHSLAALKPVVRVEASLLRSPSASPTYQFLTNLQETDLPMPFG